MKYYYPENDDVDLKTMATVDINYQNITMLTLENQCIGMDISNNPSLKFNCGHQITFFAICMT